MAAIDDNFTRFLVEDILNADTGFRMLLSSVPFTGWTIKLLLQHENAEGNWYLLDPKLDLPPLPVGCLHEPMLRHFAAAPKALYVHPENKGLPKDLGDLEKERNRSP